MVSWFLTKVSTAFWEWYSFSMNDAITTRKGWEAVGRGKTKLNNSLYYFKNRINYLKMDQSLNIDIKL